MAMAAAVEAVGARFSEQASSFTAMSRTMSLAVASVDCGLAVSVMQRNAQALHRFDQLDQFFGFAAGGNCQQHVVRREHAEVAVQRFGGVQEKRRRAGAGESGGDFAADQAGLAEAGDDDSSFASVQKFDGFFEAGVEAVDQAGDGFGFDAQDALGGCEAHWGRASHSRASARELAEFFPAAGETCSSGSALAPSESALAGLSWTSRNIPSTPAAVPARASGSMNSGWPPLDFPSPPGNCTEWVTSKTTG